MDLSHPLFKTNKLEIEKGNPHTLIICPYCESGELLFNEKTEQWLEDKDFNKEFDNNPDYDRDYMKFFYIANLECSNISCRKNIVSTGLINKHFIGGDDVQGYMESFTHIPYFFSEPLHLIHIDSKYPENVIILLENSFELFWVDKMSCANKIRICLESLMDYYKVPKKQKTKKGFKNLSLHARIKKCKAIMKSKNEDFIIAIKWIGNIGSHNSSNCTNDLLIVAYQLLDYLLQDLFINQPKLKQLSKKAKTINKTKGKKIN